MNRFKMILLIPGIAICCLLMACETNSQVAEEQVNGYSVESKEADVQTKEEIIEPDESQDNEDEMPTESNTTAALDEYVSSHNVTAFYNDYYLEGQYLIIEDDCITSLFSVSDFMRTESIKYENIVSIDVNYVGELGFVEITDKAGGNLSFSFDIETAKTVRTAIEQ